MKVFSVLSLMTLLLGLVLAASGQKQHPSSEPNATLSGDWRNADTVKPGITRVEITAVGDSLLVHVWASCQPCDCDWGTVATNIADASDDTLDVSWNQGFVVREQRLFVAGDDRLTVQTRSHYTDDSGRPDREEEEYFVPK